MQIAHFIMLAERFQGTDVNTSVSFPEYEGFVSTPEIETYTETPPEIPVYESFNEFTATVQESLPALPIPVQEVAIEKPRHPNSRTIAALGLSSTALIACNFTLPGFGWALGAGVSSALFSGTVLYHLFLGGIENKRQRQSIGFAMGMVGGLAGLAGSFFVPPGVIIGAEVIVSIALGLNDFLNSFGGKEEKKEEKK